MRMRSRTRAIDKIYKRRDRYEIPDWQRQEVWTRLKKQNLIDTLLRGWKLPKFYLLKVSEDPEGYEVVDGQQRLGAIFEFFEDQLPLASKTAEEFGGDRYSKLPDHVVDAFEDYEIEFDEIEDATEEEVKNFFQRLQEGLPLTSAEKLNSVPSKLRDFISVKAKHPFFGKTSTSDRRYGHFDILAKVVSIEIDGIEVGLRYDDLREVFESQSTFSSRSNIAKRLVAALDFVNAGFNSTEGRALRNRTIVQSLLTLVCRLHSSGDLAGQEKRIAAFFLKFLRELTKQVELGQRATDPQYLEFQRTVNANIKGGPRIRQRMLLRKLFEAAPDLLYSLDESFVSEIGVKKSIQDDAARIGELVEHLNERYAAQKGTDLFKATNRTAQALTKIHRPIHNFDEYKSLIDNLYFLFHEGTGDRLDGQRPEAFKDVSILRTGLRHDVDHGRGGKVRTKQRQIGEAFRKYAGAPSPVGLAPELFVVAQANLLSALKRDLEQLQSLVSSS